MEISLRGWLIIGGILVIALILFDGWRRIRGSRNRIRLEIDHSVLGEDAADEQTHSNPELPNGGARRCSSDERLEPSFGTEPPAPPSQSAHARGQEPAAKASGPSAVPEPVDLRDMDPLFDDVPVEHSPRARRAEPPQPTPPRHDDALDSALSQGEFDGLSLDGFADREHSPPAPAPLRASRDDRDEPASMSLDFDPEQPIPVLKDRVASSEAAGRGDGSASTAAPTTASSGDQTADTDRADRVGEASEQDFALELDEQPTSAPHPRTEPGWQPGPQSDAPAPAAEPEDVTAVDNSSAEQKRPNPAISADPEEMLVIFVVGRDKQPLPGAAIRKIVEACGMEFGEMGIYHRHEGPNAEGSLQFSMANAIQPGTFDLETLDSMETPAVTFFMSMRDPADPLYAYECMLATAETLCRHLDAELLDGDRSVMRPQTKEHYRERIHDFELHQRVKRAH